jgi:ABC-type multidrug transport system fused ATPase/permease subunit
MRDWLMAFARRYQRDGILAVICALLYTVTLQAPPALSGLFVNRVLRGHDIHMLWPIILAGILVAAIAGVFGFGESYLSARMGQGVLNQMWEALYTHFTDLPYSYYDEVQTGQLISRLISDINWVRMFFMNFFSMGTQVAFTIIFATALIFAYDWKLGLILVVLLPLLYLVVHLFDRKVRPAWREVRAQFAVMTTHLNENIAGVRVVKAFGQDERENRRFDASLDALFDRNIDATRLWSTFYPLFDLTGGVFIVVVFLYGGWQTIHGQLSIGALVAISGYVLLLVQPLRQIGMIINTMAQAVAAGQRLYELAEVNSDLPLPANPVRPARVEGTLTFDHVSLTYPSTGQTVLHDIDFHVGSGRSVAMAGPTGAGKTSVVALIPRLYDASQGRVLIDGIDVREWDPVYLRRHIGLVLQETFLFSASVHDNIAFGRPDATREQVMRAAELAQAAEFIEGMPYGYEQLIGERGIGLSGGQRQRIAIARALLVDPAIVILDDATASVDLETEAAIQLGMKNLLKGRTAIVVAHRLSSLKAADEILVIDEGHVVQRGSHDRLVEHAGLYRDVYDIQYRDQEQVRASSAS